MSPLSRQTPSLAAATSFAGGTDPFTDTTTLHHDLSSPTSETFPSDASIDADSTSPSPIGNPTGSSIRPGMRQRFAAFDAHAFGLGPGASLGQARKALEKHLAETERRLEETGRLGTQLVEQRQQVLEELNRVEEMKGEVEITPQLRTKLNDIEKEFNDVVKETARAFMPRQRVPSNENPASGSPFVPEARGRRSISPSKFESTAAGSPTKLTVPSNRRLRNQPASRIKDIEFAADISTSLIQQVRQLQALLSEREAELRDLNEANAKLEEETEALCKRLKTHDENETRFREENWNLETRVFELENREKDANDKLERLNQSLTIITTDRNSLQRELDEVKVTHSKLLEEQTSQAKAHDIELGMAKRTIATAELDRATMQRKIDDLTKQNLELTRAITMTRGRALERTDENTASDQELDTVPENNTPEHSPPPSPVKNTPRHSMLESETLKTSLMHAQRTIQSQRTQLHREKTEKLEMRRVLQDLRDELEKLREDPTNTANANVTVRKKRNVSDSRDFRKPSTRLLGTHRSSREEILLDEEEWEDNDDDDQELVKPSPNRRLFGTPSPTTNKTKDVDADVVVSSIESDVNDTSDAFETADEAQDDEEEDILDLPMSPTGTDATGFYTGAEDISEDSDALTETESPSKAAASRRRPKSINSRAARDSFRSITSNSGDEDGDMTLRTPSLPTNRFRMSQQRRGFMGRRSRTASEEPNFMSSPASYVTNSSTTGTPQHGVGHVSLFAELQDMQSDNDSSFLETPSRQGTMSPQSLYHRSVSPQQISMLSAAPFDPNRGRMLQIPNSMKRLMVDSGVNCDFDGRDLSEDEMPLLSVVMLESVVDDKPIAITAPPAPKLSVYKVEERSDSPVRQLALAAPILAMSKVSLTVDELIPAKKEVVVKPEITLSTVDGLHSEPIVITKEVKPTLAVSGVAALEDEPQAVPALVKVRPVLSLSMGAAEHHEPVVVPRAVASIPELSVSGIAFEHEEPAAPEPVILPEITASFIDGIINDAPIAVPPRRRETPSLAYSVAGFIEEIPVLARKSSITLPTLSVSHISEETEAPAPIMPIERPLSMVSVSEYGDEPIKIASGYWPTLNLSEVQATQDEPVQFHKPLKGFSKALSFSPLAGVQSQAPVFGERVVSTSLPMYSFESRDEWPVPIPSREAPVRVPELRISHIEQTVSEPNRMSFVWKAAYDEDPVTVPREATGTPELTFRPAGDLLMSPKRANRAPVPRALALSSLFDATVQPESGRSSPVPDLGISKVSHTPLAPKAVPPAMYSPISISAFDLQNIFPAPPPSRGAGIQYETSDVMAEATEPVSGQSSRQSSSIYIPKLRTASGLSFSSINVEPIAAKRKTSNNLPIFELPNNAADYGQLRKVSLSKSSQADLVSPRVESFSSARLSMSELTSVAMNPQPLSPKRAGFVMPPGVENPFAGLTSDDGQRFAALFSKDRVDEDVVIAEDETRQSERDTTEPETPEGLRPLKEVAGNSVKSARSFSGIKSKMVDSSVQTTVTSDLIDDWMSQGRRYEDAEVTSVSRVTRAASSSIRQSLDEARRTRERTLPPSSHHQRRSASLARPRTPAGSGHATSRDRGDGSLRWKQPGYIETPSKNTVHSQQSSVSSFTSEIEQRFDMARDLLGMEGYGRADPRMMMAVTETMIGEFVWKYTRRAGRNGDQHGTRRRRYFWIHPYMRMLFWCDENPMLSRKGEVVCKASRIEAVRVATDDNPMPPGLHRKSMILMTGDGAVKFTCQTGQRHETWFNALSYLLHRGGVGTNINAGLGYEPGETVGNIVRVENAENWREEEAIAAYGSTVPVLPTTGTAEQNRERALGKKQSYSTLTNRINNAFSTLRSRASSNNLAAQSLRKKRSILSGAVSGASVSYAATHSTTTTTEQDEAHDSAEDLRVVYVGLDRENGLENVRACCDGKHDVGTLRGGRWGSRGDLWGHGKENYQHHHHFHGHHHHHVSHGEQEEEEEERTVRGRH